MQRTQRQRQQRQEKEVEQAPWDYEGQNRENAELLLGLPAGRPTGVITQSEWTGRSWDMRTSNNESADWAKILAQDLAEVPPFDLDGCSNEWSIFDIRRHDDCPQIDINERARGRPPGTVR